jgi:hypothetical protein
MSNLLKAVGFWMWGLIAIGLSLSLVSVSYRMLSVYRWHDLSASARSSAPSPNAEVSVPPILFSEKTKQAPSATKEMGVDASRQSAITAEKMTASRSAAQADQATLNSLEAAEPKAPPAAYDSNSVQGYSNISLDKFKAKQAAYEAAVSRGAYKVEELARVFRALFQLAAVNQQSAKAIEYGEKANELGALKPNDLLIMSQIYYQRKDCKDSAVWGDKAIAAFKKSGEAPKEVLYQLKLQCASDANDSVGMIAALYDLVRLTTKPLIGTI